MTLRSNSMPAGRIGVEINGPIGWLVIDNPTRKNAVTLAMWRDIPRAVEELCDDEAVRVIVVRGAGEETFIAGADITEFASTRADSGSARIYEEANAAAFDALRQSPKPTVAMIRGFCLGGGLGIAVACDMRVAEAGSRFSIPAARLGVGYPPNAIRDVVKLIGPQRAKDLFFTARRVAAEEALRIGLIDRLTIAGGLETELAALLSAIAENAPLTQIAAKAAIDAISGDPEAADWKTIQRLSDACFDSGDFAEGRSAFLEKRTPRFKGS